MSDAAVCPWCRKGIVPGDSARDPRPQYAGDGRRMHVRCAATCRQQMQRWADAEQGAIGFALLLLQEVLECVHRDGSLLITATSPGFVQLTEAVMAAKGAAAWTPPQPEGAPQ